MTKPIPAEDLEASRGLWGSDLGRAFDLLVANGLAYAELREPSEQGVRRFAVRCPFEAQHKSGFSERDCILIGARHVGGDGWIACSHASCAGRSQSEFLAALKASPLRGDAPERCDAILEGLPADPSDADLIALRVDGRDEFSTMKLPELRARCGIDELRDHPYELQALRWCARGLDAVLAVRWAAAMSVAYPR